MRYELCIIIIIIIIIMSYNVMFCVLDVFDIYRSITVWCSAFTIHEYTMMRTSTTYDRALSGICNEHFIMIG